MQPTLTLRGPKLVQNIKIRIWCDGRVYTRFSFPPSWIWAIRVSSHFQSHELQKRRPRSKRPCFALNGQNNLWGRFDEVKHCEEILKSYKIVCHLKNRLNVFIQKLPSKIYKMCNISGIKRHQKKLSSLCRILAGNFCYLMGHFPNSREVQNLAGAPQKWGTGASFAIHAMGIQE